MRERPIIFSAPMVQAILAGRKTVTRRVATYWRGEGNRARKLPCDLRPAAAACHYGAPGGRLWVRETWAAFKADDRPNDLCVAYRASCGSAGAFDYAMADGSILGAKIERWTPSIHMPRWASRITLEIISVRVERLQEITEEDARAEGVAAMMVECRPDAHEPHRGLFAILWDQINGKRAPWVSNPWVWRVEFRRMT